MTNLSREEASQMKEEDVTLPPFTLAQKARYARHLTLEGVGMRGQQKLMDSKVLIVGAGGLGSPAALYLAAAGVGTITLVDGDDVALSNLQRQILYATDDVGCPKVHSARQKLTALNPEVTVIPLLEKARADNIASWVAQSDFVLICTDSLSSKFLINDACVRGKKPFTFGGVTRFEGQIFTFVPQMGPCLRCVFGNPPQDVVSDPTEEGVLGAVAGIIGTLQALEAIKCLTGVGHLLTGSLLTFDALTLEMAKIRLSSEREPCSICHPR